MARSASKQLTARDGRPYTWAQMCRLDTAIHEEMFERGVAPQFSDIVGWEFQGWNRAPAASLMGIRRYVKGFYAKEPVSEKTDHIWGYNLWVRQTGEPGAGPWIPSNTWFPVLGERVPERPKRHGIYKVTHAAEHPKDNKHPHALLLDYGEGNNPLSHLGRVLRDYVVQVYPDDPTLLLGRAYTAVGEARLPAPGHFMMVRFQRGHSE